MVIKISLVVQKLNLVNKSSTKQSHWSRVLKQPLNMSTTTSCHWLKCHHPLPGLQEFEPGHPDITKIIKFPALPTIKVKKFINVKVYVNDIHKWILRK